MRPAVRRRLEQLAVLERVAVPLPERAVLQLERVVLRPERAAPQLEQVVPLPERVVPRPERAVLRPAALRPVVPRLELLQGQA